jgi:arginyl-tRNA synthetase
MNNLRNYISASIENNFNIKILLKFSQNDYIFQDNNFSNLAGEYEFYTITKLKNIYLVKIKDNFLISEITRIYNNNNLIDKIKNPQKIIVEYSSPNIAKEMHVGHMRSTIIGDSLSNFLEFLGHNVLRINHIGDFGSQFGKIIQYIIINNINLDDNIDLHYIYKQAILLAEKNNDFLLSSQQRTSELQNKIEPTYSIHTHICDISKFYFNEIYKLLQIKSIQEIGESFYADFAIETINHLKDIIIDYNGCQIINTTYNIPLYITTSHNTYTYDTTDLCALYYRTHKIKVDKILYCVGNEQQLHFKQIFEIANIKKWHDPEQIKHINFGMVLDENGKKIKSRDGTTLKLKDLINESINKTHLICKDRNLSEDDIIQLAIGSLKYAELKTSRINDYKFSYDKMLDFNGNSLCYIMYGYVRICKIINNINSNNFINNNKDLNTYDFNIIRKILFFPEIIEKTHDTYCMHHICSYLYELIVTINKMYENNKIIEYNTFNCMRFKIIIIAHKIINTIFEIINIKPLSKM